MSARTAFLFSSAFCTVFSGCGGDGAASDPGSEVTWHGQVRSVVDEHCVRCHNPDGLGIGDFTNPEEAVAYADLMAAAVEEGRMPPPVSSPECREYVGADRLFLDDEERGLITAWAADAAPLGNSPANAPPPPSTPELAEPDLELRIPQPYVPTYPDPEDAGNEYRCFVLDPQRDAPFFITALAPIVDQESLLHHAVLSTGTRANLTDEMRNPAGFNCIGGMNIDASGRQVVAWAPGMLPVELPAGMGVRVDPEQVLILQMHYFASPGSEGLADQSGYAFRTAASVETEVAMTQLGLLDFEIPAGDSDFRAGGTFKPRADQEIVGIFPHMHLLGSSFTASIERADGSEACLLEGTYDFDNQLTYQYRERVPLGPDDRIHYECGWNNSESNPELSGPPVATGFGERTDEEMCFFFMLATTDPDEATGDVVEDVDPGSLQSGQVQINLGADVAGMVLGDQCVGTVTVEAEGGSFSGDGSCTFSQDFAALLGSEALPVTLQGDATGGTLTLGVGEGAQVDAVWQGTVVGSSVVGRWSGQEAALDNGVEVVLEHAGAFRVDP